MKRFQPIGKLFIILLVLVGAACTDTKTYHLDVNFFVELSKSEVAQVTFDLAMQNPDGKQQLKALRKVEELLLINNWSHGEWEIFAVKSRGA